MNTNLLKIENITYRYSEEANYALNNLSFSVQQGEWLAIVGHNGSGKSTLARILNGLLLPKSGTVSVDGITLTEDSIWDIRKKIGMVFQNPDNQFVGTTVKDDIAFGLENNGVSRDVMIERIDKVIKLVKMEDFLDNEPHQLSGGQKQRVAIAGVLAVQPDLIILDEATSMLDPIGREEVLNTIRQIKTESNITVISITHDLEEAARADRIIVLNQGQLFAEGTPEEIFSLDEKLIEIGLDLPFSVKVSKKLRAIGIQLTKNHITEEGLVDELWTLQSKI
ncbi:energy-coupling factor ABC transporter ATP-binding protein [Fredinandcohnia quinoae]|uniref:Energy-coupling factor ABC transporter ATP-binding protein n=1 Tax=Fredinandcohnia quinoae TaxID=2918902 RepID=A0AAW5E3B8_9BACI|nr:energy-coupling factor ABC transporter ATP-binding protein [Fredinandcohnia sp. SECRCQ15]MCH1626054.1 energy-coupling factor ABC transporter ATP-binding protein [Fredinandcohnia sp. SECRCQ15]